MIKIYLQKLNSLILICFLVTGFSAYSQSKRYLNDGEVEQKIALNVKEKKQKNEGIFKEYRIVISKKDNNSNVDALIQNISSLNDIKKCVFDEKSKELRIDTFSELEKQVFLKIVKETIYNNGFSTNDYYELIYTY